MFGEGKGLVDVVEVEGLVGKVKVGMVVQGA